jgi:hypothetical protein
MQTDRANLYEQAFQCFLTENKLPFVWIDQSKCLEYQDGPIKNFDFLVKPDTDSAILIELKGRSFKGTSLNGLKGLDGWVTFEDVRSLSHWLGQFPKDEPQRRWFSCLPFALKILTLKPTACQFMITPASGSCFWRYR